MKIKEKAKKWAPWGIGGAVVVIFLLLISILLYGFGRTDNVVVKKVSVLLPFPSAMGSNFWISRGELEKRTDAVVHFYENQDFGELGLRVDFSTEEGKKRLKIKEKDVLERLIEDRIVEKLASERRLKISTSEVSQAVERKIGEYSSGDYLRENMDRLYGWNLDDFEENIVKPDLYKENLSAYVENNESDFQEARKKIEEADLELKKGKDFFEVAKNRSEGESGSSGGDLGWFTKKQILSDIVEKVFSQKIGERSEILESSLGFHIIRVEEKKNENGDEMIKLRQIFVRKKDFGDWLTEQKKNFNILVPEPGLRWNKNEGRLDFEKEEMQKYEEQVKENPTGDASLIF